jgi:hypothetical protein
VYIFSVDHSDQAFFTVIEKRTKLQLDREQISGFELTGDAPTRQKGLPPVKGKRPNKKIKPAPPPLRKPAL